MRKAQAGDTVAVHYRGTLDSGELFDSSEGGDPLKFRIGDEQVIPGFEQAVVGMEVGDKKTERIPADNAYGPHRTELVLSTDRSAIPDDVTLEEGDIVEVMFSNGQRAPVRVMRVSDEGVELDANHPLAGQDLTFELELVAIE